MNYLLRHIRALVNLRALAVFAAVALLGSPSLATRYLQVSINGVDQANGIAIEGFYKGTVTSIVEDEILEFTLGILSYRFGQIRVGDALYTTEIKGYEQFFCEFIVLNGVSGANSFSLLSTFRGSGCLATSQFTYTTDGITRNVPLNNFTRFSASISNVPETATWLMLLSGFAFTGAAIRRRARLSAPAHTG